MTDQTVIISVSMDDEVAHQLAQFAKRSTFDTFYQFTEGTCRTKSVSGEPTR